MMLAFAIVQWGIVLPVQVYFVWRSWRNWKQSERELADAHQTQCTLRHALEDFRAWAKEEGCDLDDVIPPLLQ